MKKLSRLISHIQHGLNSEIEGIKEDLNKEIKRLSEQEQRLVRSESLKKLDEFRKRVYGLYKTINEAYQKEDYVLLFNCVKGLDSLRGENLETIKVKLPTGTFNYSLRLKKIKYNPFKNNLTKFLKLTEDVLEPIVS